jgi:hypothetical protein
VPLQTSGYQIESFATVLRADVVGMLVNVVASMNTHMHVGERKMDVLD